MFQKHIKAVSLTLVLCLIAVMFAIVAILNNGIDSNASEIMLIIFVAVACVPVFLVHEKHD